MTKEQFCIALETLGLKQDEAAGFLGACRRTVDGWRLGHHRIPRSTAVLLWVMIAKKLSTKEVERIATGFNGGERRG